MRRVHTVVIGAGQAGLAMSRCLDRRNVEHVVLERGRVAERWRSERWDSLRLLTPNWMSRLPGWSYRGGDPDGYMAMPELIGTLERYARLCRAPVECGTEVRSVERDAATGRYRVATSRGDWEARAVVVATGHCGFPAVPAMARSLPAGIRQVTPSDYRDPAALPDGGVLVVGASATGVQLAEEIHRSGRPVSLSVGRHTRLPRVYRGRDIMWWMDRLGVLGEAAERVEDLRRARGQPSLQLVGRPDRRSIDLRLLQDLGVRVLGRAAGVDGGVLRLRDDLADSTAAAQRTLARLLARIDAHGRDGAVAGPTDEAAALLQPLGLAAPPASLDLAAENIRTVLWATGYGRDYGWLKVPAALDAAGEIAHRGGVTPSPGLYVLGLRFMRRRNSSFLDGVGADAEALAEHLFNTTAATAAAPGRAAA